MIIIVGMARSGTTFTADLLAKHKDVKVLIEPHILWRTGNFLHYYDDKFRINNRITSRIRSKMLTYAGDKILVEKSPINCLRSDLVHATFPDAKIVYVERDAHNCIQSNYRRSIKNDSFKFSIIVKKYLGKYNDENLESATETMSVKKQFSLVDLLPFSIFVIRSLFYRNVLKVFPFGPKLKGFVKIVREQGLIGYHRKVLLEAEKNKANLQKLYGDRLSVFRLEELQTNEDEIKRLFDFCSLAYSREFIEDVFHSIDQKRIGLFDNKQQEETQPAMNSK
jgi:hypothetical protein